MMFYSTYKFGKYFFLLNFFLLFSLYNFSQENKKEIQKSTGVSVSPAHFHFNQKQGEIKTYEITVKNKTTSSKQFKVNIFDFNMNENGKSNFLSAGKGKYSLSKWLNISPTFIELEPFENKKVRITVTIPNDDRGRKAAWSIIMIEQETPRTSLLDNKRNDGSIALGVIPTFAFGIFAYQNPPNVIDNQIELTDFQFNSENNKNSIYLTTKNAGDGIAYCTSYIDLTNLETGDQQRLQVKKFTILPDLVRNFTFNLPDTLPKGKYLAVGVLDYENAEEIQAAKLEFEID